MIREFYLEQYGKNNTFEKTASNKRESKLIYFPRKDYNKNNYKGRNKQISLNTLKEERAHQPTLHTV
jgi:hypothetical protein